MSALRTIAAKELRSCFRSPVALIFLGIYLAATLFVFFSWSRFFARNIADVRPLFEWLPVLAIFLVSALTMRAWSEEERSGTLEILLTLPVKTWELVAGKFAAGMALVVLALALTLPLPVAVSFLGQLDWGPVIGGYAAALALAAAYMAIGLCVSSRTDNQIVALMVTALVCGVLYLVGSEGVTSWTSDATANLLRAVASGARFDSIARGVLDLRDLAYYGAIVVFFLALNVDFLEAKRADLAGAAGRGRQRARLATMALVGANALALGLWLAPVTSARMDLTADGAYSLSPATGKILANLEEPLLLAGYFSEKTHPLLAPLVPRIRDLLLEYQIRGGGHVRVQMADPSRDPELEEEIAQAYDVRSVPFRVSGRYEESVVNSYFHVLVRYGDRFEVLDFQDLIEVHMDGMDADVRLRNLEYDITRAIRKTTEGFRTIGAMLADVDGGAVVTAYISKDALPEQFVEVPERLRKVVTAMSEEAGGLLEFHEIDPTGNPALQSALHDTYGFQPLTTSIFSGEQFWLHLLVQVGQRTEGMYLQDDLTEAAIRTTLEASIRRASPGFLRTVALMTRPPTTPPADPGLPPQMQPPAEPPLYRGLEQSLNLDFRFQRIDAPGPIPADVDVLILARPGKLDETARRAVDQFLMRGGAVIVFAGAYDIDYRGGDFVSSPIDAGLRELLAGWGVTVDDAYVLSAANARFPVPIQERRGPLMLERIVSMDYPFFPDIRPENMNRANVATSGLANVIANWSSPLELKAPQGVTGEVLLRSPADSWRRGDTALLPASVDEAATAFPPEGEQKSEVLAVALTGRFPSQFAGGADGSNGTGDVDSETGRGDDGSQGAADTGADAGESTANIRESAPGARVAVVGSSAFASDVVAAISMSAGGEAYRGNMQLVRNLVDWALADTDLLSIRSAGAFARTLRPLTDAQRRNWELGIYLVVLGALALVVALAAAGRRRVRSLAEEGSR